MNDLLDLNAKPPRSLRRNVLSAAMANGVFALTQWAILIVVARLGSVEDVGVVTVVTALVTPIFMFSQMAMRDSHSVDDLDVYTRADYVALRLVSSLLAFALVGVLVATYLAPSGGLMQSAALAFAVVKYLGGQTNMNHGIFQRAERLDYVGWSLLSRGVLGFLGFAACYWVSRSLVLAFLAEALMWWLCLMLVDQPLLRRLDAQVPFSKVLAISPRRIVQLARWMLPLGFGVFLMTAAASLPRLVLERYVDLATVGIFGAIAYINVALSLFSNSIGTASAARLRRLYRSGDKARFCRLSVKLTIGSAALGVTIWLGALWAGEPILHLVYGEEYVRSDLLQLAIAAAALRIAAAPLLFALNAGQAFKRRMNNSVLTFCTGLAASLTLIPSHGAIGAAWALVVLSAASLAVTAVSFLKVLSSMPSRSNRPTL